jgi:hypothetical protein
VTGPEHYREAEVHLKKAYEAEGGSDWERYHVGAAQVHATLAQATAVTPATEHSRYGSEFDRLADRWCALETEHDQLHPDRDECGGVGGCSLMAAAYDLRTQMRDALESWRVTLAVREGLRPCGCDHHGDHAGCDVGCECAS